MRAGYVSQIKDGSGRFVGRKTGYRYFQGLDAVIHLAAASSSLADWESVLQQNIITTYNVFEEARRAGVSKIVFASTNHTQHAYTMLTNTLNEDLSYVKKHGLVKLSDPPAPIHSTASRSFSEKTWDDIIRGFSASRLFPCVSAGPILRK